MATGKAIHGALKEIDAHTTSKNPQNSIESLSVADYCMNINRTSWHILTMSAEKRWTLKWKYEMAEM